MSRIIKVTKRQLKEAEGDIFQYLKWDDNTRPYSGHSEIAASGKLGDNENGDPLTTDKVAKMVSPQSAVRYRGNAAMRGTMAMRENNDKDGDGVDDFYNHKELDTLSNGDRRDDTRYVPESVVRKLDQMLEAVRTAALRPKQLAMVLNKVIESFNLGTIPYSWRKELSMKILNAVSDNQKINM